MTSNYDKNFPYDPEVDRIEPGIQRMAEFLFENPAAKAEEYKSEILKMGFSDKDFDRIHSRALCRSTIWALRVFRNKSDSNP
jgi:hypothetical protein